MKAGLIAREPEILARWEREKLYERIQEARKEAGESIYSSRRAPLRQRRRAYGHCPEQDLKRLRCEVAHHGWLPGSLRSRMGLPWATDRIQGGQGIEGPCSRRSPEAVRGLRAKICRRSEAAIPTLRGLGRLGESLSHPLAAVRSRYHPLLCQVLGERTRLSIEEAGLLEHRRPNGPR